MVNMKKIISTLSVFLFTTTITFAQTVQPIVNNDTPNLKTLLVKPSETDTSIKAANTPHLIRYKTTNKSNKILLFMVGTNGIASKTIKNAFLATALEQGYRVISLSYITTPAGAVACAGKNRIDDPDCIEKFRIKRIYGENLTPLFPDEPQDAIINRFTKLLLYLEKNDKAGNWGQYLQNGSINWKKIAVAGQSQGGGMGAYIAKQHLVAKVIYFSGGWDVEAKGKIAKWYYKDSVTPPNRWYATYHVEEPMAHIIAQSCNAMKIPKAHTFALNLPINGKSKAHGQGVANKLYKPIWIQMLGRGD